MNIVIAPDSFKDCLTAIEVATAIEDGLLSKNPHLNIRKIAIADGGEGSVEVLMQSCKAERVEITLHDPLFREIKSSYAIIPSNKTAIIEMAKASGIELLSLSERNPLKTSTFGTGEMIKDALDRGCRKFICFIGGSATNDGGMGMAQALGVKFYDSNSRELQGVGKELANVDRIVVDEIDPRIAESQFTVACDVTNPLVGSFGATYVYGRQKGANDHTLEQLEVGMINYLTHLNAIYGSDINSLKGAGAAGGLGAGMVTFLSGKLESGIDIIMKELELATHFEWADVVITGEGRMDGQTLNGKAPYRVAQLAKSYGCRVIGVAGVFGEGYEKLLDSSFDYLVSLKTDDITTEYSIANAAKLLKNKNYKI